MSDRYLVDLAGTLKDNFSINGTLAVKATRQIVAGSGLTGGGDLSADRTLTLDQSAIAIPASQITDFAAAVAAVPGFGIGTTASAVTFTPAGTIGSTDVQAAVEEVASEAAGALAAHEGAGDPHGDRAYADTGDIATLAAANAYTDAQIAAIPPGGGPVAAVDVSCVTAGFNYYSGAATDVQTALQNIDSSVKYVIDTHLGSNDPHHSKPLVQGSMIIVESGPADSAAHNLMVNTFNDGLICMGSVTAGRWGTYNFSTGVWTTGTFTGAATAVYTWAVYVQAIDLIWAGNAFVTHIIDPTTKVATDVTGSTGIIKNCAYSAVSSQMYGFVAGSGDVLEMEPATGFVNRTFASGLTGFELIGINPNNGDILLLTLSGPNVWKVVPYVAFNTIVTSVTTGASMTFASSDRIVVEPFARFAFAFNQAQSAAYTYDFAGAANWLNLGAMVEGGARAVWSPGEGKVYVNGAPSHAGLYRLSVMDYRQTAEAAVVLPHALIQSAMEIGGDGYIYSLSSSFILRISV